LLSRFCAFLFFSFFHFTFISSFYYQILPGIIWLT